MPGPPPLLRDDRLSLELLGRMAGDFDSISAEGGRTWPATDFVKWLADEVAASAPEPAERSEAA